MGDTVRHGEGDTVGGTVGDTVGGETGGGKVSPGHHGAVRAPRQRAHAHAVAAHGAHAPALHRVPQLHLRVRGGPAGGGDGEGETGEGGAVGDRGATRAGGG